MMNKKKIQLELYLKLFRPTMKKFELNFNHKDFGQGLFEFSSYQVLLFIILFQI